VLFLISLVLLFFSLFVWARGYFSFLLLVSGGGGEMVVMGTAAVAAAEHKPTRP